MTLTVNGPSGFQAKPVSKFKIIHWFGSLSDNFGRLFHYFRSYPINFLPVHITSLLMRMPLLLMRMTPLLMCMT